jgi:mono/diheme cytochrome c family protein
MKVGGVVRVLLWIVVVLCVIAGVGYAGVVLASNRMLRKTVDVPVIVEPFAIPEGNPTAIARGKYLADHALGCPECHGADFGGSAPIDDPMMGTLWAKNLTLGQGSAVRDYQPLDWARAIRHGVGKNGRRLVLMPSEDFGTYGDEDLGSLVAYIKSLPIVNREDRGIQVGPLARVLFVTEQVTFAFDKIDHKRPRPVAQPGPTKEWGQVMVGACRGCHGETLSGGPIPGGPPDWPPARNLTPHDTGLGSWTFDQFERAFRHGKRPDGTELQVMPWKAYAGMTDSDVTAIWQYLRTVPAKAAGGR